MFAEWDLRYLEDPLGALGGAERVHALARPGLDQAYPPEVLELLTRMFIPLPELEAALLTATRTSVDAAVEALLRRNRARVDYWMTGQLPSAQAEETPDREPSR
jgi:glycine betaine/proline transport system substrate-binding protein